MLVLPAPRLIALHDLDLMTSVLALRQSGIRARPARRQTWGYFVVVVVQALEVLRFGVMGRDAELVAGGV